MNFTLFLKMFRWKLFFSLESLKKKWFEMKGTYFCLQEKFHEIPPKKHGLDFI